MIESDRTLAVSAQGLTKRFGDRVAVDGLDLAVPAGSVCGFVGPNGAGKTTTIRMLLGLIAPTSGTGTVLGGDLGHPWTYLDNVGALIEAPAFYPQLSGRDNLLALARLGQIDPSVIAGVLARVGLGQRAGDSYRTYSLGMKQRLGLAAALLPSPDLLLLDEPTNGLDPAGIVEMRDLIRSLADDGMTVFVSSHLLAEIEHICDHLVMLRDGRTVFQGDVASLRATRGSELILRPEDAAHLASLVEFVQRAGWPARVEETARGRLSVVVSADPSIIGSLNRECVTAGFTLVHVEERTRTLEDAFFELTGTHSGDPLGRDGAVGAGAGLGGVA